MNNALIWAIYLQIRKMINDRVLQNAFTAIVVGHDLNRFTHVPVSDSRKSRTNKR
jgi:hypothetical protein